MKRLLLLHGLAVAIACTTSCGPAGGGESARPTLTLHVAASLSDVMVEVAAAFAGEQSEPVGIVYNIAASGTLSQQIRLAPRGDVFLSASAAWMDAVEVAGRLAPGTRRTFLSNQLCVVAHPEADRAIEVPAGLCGAEFRYLAVGDPDSVPAGSYARQWLESLPCPGGGNAWQALEGRRSPAPDVRAVLAQVEASRDVLGIVYRTDALARAAAVRVVHAVPPDRGPVIAYQAAALREGEASVWAGRFLAFLETPAAVRIFERHGFSVPPPAP